MDHQTGHSILALVSLLSNTKDWHTTLILYSLFPCIAFLGAHEKSWCYIRQAPQGSLALIAYFFSGMQLQKTIYMRTSCQAIKIWLRDCSVLTRILSASSTWAFMSNFIVVKLLNIKFSIDLSQTCSETLTNSWQLFTGKYYLASIKQPILNQFVSYWYCRERILSSCLSKCLNKAH